ncbi:MAG: GLUG motif-containing protein [Syntrophomonadaceae bacterium]|nr:GLUG motif-containing protein [Syntrophomonadaceae bacterium]
MLKKNLSNPKQLTLRKFFSLLLAVAMLVSLFPGAAYATFSDVQGHWGQTAIEKWSGQGIVCGADGAFRPDEPITRGEIAVIIDKVMHYQTKAKNGFSDLGQAFYTDAILKANAAGVISGDGNAVRPADNITREEAVVMLGRALGLREKAAGSTAFFDAAKISPWASGYINAMAGAGYVQGSNGQFKPKAGITRAEVVTILNNSVKQLYNENKEYTGNISGTAIVNTPGAVLKDTKISGDLIIAEGVGNGDITMNNVTVSGNTLVRGGGSDSIHIKGGQISHLIMEKTDGGSIRIVSSEGAVVEAVLVDKGTDDIILTGSFASITVTADVGIKAVDAQVGQVDVTARNAVLNVDKDSVVSTLNVAEAAADTKITVSGRVETLTANAKISVSNQGTITKAQINANGVSINGNAPATTNVAATIIDKPAATTPSASSGTSSGGGGGGSSSSTFAGGNGTVSSPYQIATAAQLDRVRNYLDKHFILTADIDISGCTNWTPIGTFDEALENGGLSDLAFSGTFDGNGHSVSNLTASHQDLVGVGLFGVASSGAVIKNLTVENASVIGYMATAGIIGYNFGSVENLTLKGKNTISGVNCTGGILGGSGYGDVKNCTVEDVTINVLGDNDFSSGPIIQCDVAECGGLIIGGGGFSGSIENCSAKGEIIAAGNEPVGLGGIGGCLIYLESITGCTADVTVTAPNSAHAVGGLCGYAGTGDPENPAVIENCSAALVMNTANATHIGGLVGTGLYFMGMETVFAINNCNAEGQIIGAVTPGTIAGRAMNCTIADCTSDVLIDGVQGTAEIGTTERMYESADQPEGFENLSAWANRGSGSFESLVNYVNDDALSDLWNAAASSEMAQMMAGMFGVQVTDGESLKAMFANMASTPANNGTQIYQMKYANDYKTISFCDNDGNVIESHPYTFVESNNNLGMLAGETTYVFKADDDAGVLNYIAMLKPHFDEGMDEATMPAHVHFYYAASKDALGTYKPDSVTLGSWMPTMFQMSDEFSTADKVAMFECLFGIDNANEEQADIGILVVAHGSGEEWNQSVRESVAEVEVPYPVELGFLDVETESIPMAVQALEEKGVKRIVAVPIFICSASSHMEEIKYMLGLPGSIDDAAALEDGLARIQMTAAVELTSALDDHLLIAEILDERVESLSQNAAEEIVVLVAHGTSDPDNLAVWKEKMASLGDKLQQIHGFKQVCYGFVGAGTPGIRTVVEEVINNNPDCTVIVMPVMLSEGVYTSTKIPNALDGITYLYPEAGQRALLPHANIALYIASRANDAIMGDIEVQEAGQTYVVQYSDVALEEGGKVCVCGSFAYRAMQEALEVLSPGAVADRSRFTVVGPNSEGTEVALQAILGDGRYQLEERPHNEDYYSYQITDCESGTILTVKALSKVFPDNFFAIKTKVKNNTASSEEKKAFQDLRAQVVEKVRWEDADNLFTIEASTAFTGGSGTESDPYQIATAEQLDGVRYCLNKHFILTADIDLSGYENWEPIGTFQPASSAPEDAETPNPAVAFTGTFNGNGHTISNVTINKPEGMATGLFGCVIGDIYDLTVENLEVTGCFLSGGVVGYQASECTLENVSLIGSNTVRGWQAIGGITGGGFGDLINCDAVANIEVLGNGGCCAGVLIGGQEGESLIDSCTVEGTVTATGDDCFGLGGLAGQACPEGESVADCRATVSITASGANNTMIGGLIGYTGTYDIDTLTQITRCSSDINITVSNSTNRVGGLVGGSFYQELYSEDNPEPTLYRIIDCSASGSITGGGNEGSIGSIAGYAYNSTVDNCTSTMTWDGGVLEQIGLAETGQEEDQAA